MTGESVRVCLVCSAGGHFYELYCLREAWKEYDSFWVTFASLDTQYVLKNARAYTAYSPTNRSIKNLVRNLVLAWRILLKERPQVIVSTGAGVCVPFFLISRLRRIKTVYIESLARIHKLSLTGRMVYPLSDEFIVQWPELAERLRKATFRGQLL